MGDGMSILRVLKGKPAFSVLLGPDYAGKSSIMAELRATAPDWCLVSVDSMFVAGEHAVLSTLKRALVADTLPGLGTAYSTDFAVSLAQTAIVYLRDRVLAADPDTPVLVDSYYYKILAKCRLLGADDHPMFAWWRGFPQPQQVLYLEVAPNVAWDRADHVNRMEHYGTHPDRDTFEFFQADLHKLMLDEVRDLPVTYLPQHADIADTARDVREVLTGDRP
jgi:thymidylate kinase